MLPEQGQQRNERHRQSRHGEHLARHVPVDQAEGGRQTNADEGELATWAKQQSDFDRRARPT
jgi:hypothetical protein